MLSLRMLSSRFEFVIDHDWSDFWGAARCFEALPIVRLKLGVAGSSEPEYLVFAPAHS